MKKVIKLVLFLLLLIILIIFYKVYFSENKESNIKDNISEEKLIIPEEQKLNDPENNLIKNLKYEVKLDGQNQYIITSDLSEIAYKGGKEFVKMQKVTAILKGQKNIPLNVTSELATFDNRDYDTKFSQNVRIEYLDNIILSDKMDFDFKNRLIIIYQNVKYDGIQGNIIADNIKINLISKKIEIYMSNANDSVKVTTK